MSVQRRRGSLTARLRTDIGENEPPTTDNKAEQDGFPCPSQIRPLLHFYKYLQPLPSGRKLQLNLPATVVCEKRNGKEDLLSLRTDAVGNVVKEDKGPTWRKRLLTDFIGEDHQNAASLLSVALDDVVAVRNVAHWKSSSGGSSGGINSKSLVLTRRAFDYVINAPSELAFSLQQYVRCRGSHASIFRVTWGERENRRFAINICNGKKITDAPPPVSSAHANSPDEPRPLGTPLDISLQQMGTLSPFYLVTSTSGSDVKRQQEQLKLPRIRGNPVADGLHAVKRIIDHVTSQLPGIKMRELTADFIKDDFGVWWFIRVVHFDACYRIAVPPAVSSDYDMDSAVAIPEALRSKYFRQLLHSFPSVPPENAMVPQCALCGCSCDLPKPLREELELLAGHSHESDGRSGEVFQVLSEYRMTLKMVVTTLFQLRQRGASLPVWEHVALLLIKTPAGLASEFTVCYLCYRIYKSQLQLARIATELHEVYGVQRPHDMTDDSEDSREDQSTESLVDQIRLFYNEKCVSFVAEEPSLVRNQLTCGTYSPVRGVDIDPTCLQLRFLFFFHELQDGGPELSPTDFYLEYHIGQQFTRLDFDGSKRHTQNRWQLCEARVHYLLTTLDGFSDYCNEKRLRIKMKTVLGDEYHGHTSMSLRPLLSAAKWYGKTMEHESRVDYLLELKTDAFGLLTLKLTLGLLVDTVPLSQVRELMKDQLFLREDPYAVFWPPASFQSCSLVVPVDWLGALTPSEYVTLQPVRNRRNPADRRRMGAILHRQQSVGNAASRRQILLEAKSPSQLFSASQFQKATATLAPSVDDEMNLDMGAAFLAARTLAAVVQVAKRVIYRVAGEAAQFPVVLLGKILRYASFLSSEKAACGEASWTAPARFLMTTKYTIDTLFHGIELPSTAAMCLVGEICLVLLRSQMVPMEIGVAQLEKLLEPYWLPGLRTLRGGQLLFEVVPNTVSSVQSQHRVVWNRAVRRCQVANFCGEFRAHDRFTKKQSKLQQQTRQSGISLYEGMRALSRKMSYRAKTLSHKICEIFEAIEASDSGYIEIAEFRSYHKQCVLKLHNQLKPSPMGLYHSHDHLPDEELASLDSVLRSAHEKAEIALVSCLMESEQMQVTLAQFDRLGSGGMNFDEFWDLAETVVGKHMSSYAVAEDEPTSSVFCLRHGMTEGFSLDRCCVRCSAQYQDQELLPRRRGSSSYPESTCHGESEAGDVDGSDDENRSEAEDPQQVRPQLKADGTGRNLRRPTEPKATTQSVDDEQQHDDDRNLVNTLEKLEAAEWHVRHRRESLGHAALQAALSERRMSSLSSARRASSVSIASDKAIRPRIGTDAVYAVTDFVAEAEERKQLAFNGFNEGSKRHVLQRLPSKKKPKKQQQQQPTVTKGKRRKRSVAQHSTRLQSSQSLSTLLRMELEDATHSSQRCDVATRSTRLIETVNRGESKRKQLDRLVLAELDDVKQRLARLLQSS